MLVVNREKFANVKKRIFLISLSCAILFSSFILYKKSPYFYENVEEMYGDFDFSSLPSTSNSDVIQSEIEERGYAIGIDLSYCQSQLDCDRLFQHNSEVKFCIIRVNNFWTDTQYSDTELQNIIDNGDYSKVIDSDFLNQALSCKKNNIPIGIYYWPTCKSEKRTELETQIIINYLNYIRECYGIYLELPVCLDIEYGDSDDLLCDLKKLNSLSEKCIQLSIDMLRENNYFPMIYCNEQSYDVIFATNFFTGEKTRDFGNVDVWFASHVDGVYSIEDLSTKIGDKYEMIINGHSSVLGQVSNDANLLGTECIDINVMYKNLLSIVHNSGLNFLDEKKPYKNDM